MMLTSIALGLLLFTPPLITVFASDITSFTDEKCTRSWRGLDTVNGYPDGLCKPLNVTRGQSFQIQELDSGCAVTLYGANKGPLSCSSATKIVGHLATCYDSSWVYYSIDGCLPPTSFSTKVSSSKATSTGPSATKSVSGDSESKLHTGVIVGSAVGGVSCIILSLTGILLILRRRGKIIFRKPTYELSEDRALAESDAAAEKKHPEELWADHAAVEIGRNSRCEGSLSNQTTQDVEHVRGINPLIRIHHVR